MGCTTYDVLVFDVAQLAELLLLLWVVGGRTQV